MIEPPRPFGVSTGLAPKLLVGSVAVLKNAKLGHPAYEAGPHTVVSERVDDRPILIEWKLDRPLKLPLCEIWVRYASQQERPVTILVNGKPVFTHAAYEITGGWGDSNQIWRYQGSMEFTEDIFQIDIRGENSIPHLTAVALYPIAAVTQQTNIDEAFAADRGNVAGRSIREMEELALARTCVDEIQCCLGRGVRADSIVNTLVNLIHAIHEDMIYPQRRIGFGGPFNGQERRQDLLFRLDRCIEFAHFLETGAYRGTSTAFFAKLKRPVFSCEKIDQYFYFALARLASCKNVRLYRQDSRSFLKTYFQENHQGAPIFAYLDAHWENDLPLAEEIDIIAENAKQFVLMVDDFKNLFFPYSYDRYSSGIELTIEYLLPRLKFHRELAYYFFNVPPEMETGAQRGTLIVATPDLATEHLDRDRYLQRYLVAI